MKICYSSSARSIAALWLLALVLLAVGLRRHLTHHVYLIMNHINLAKTLKTWNVRSHLTEQLLDENTR